MSADPKVLVLDEPTSALDVSIQAQVLDLLVTLQRERGTAYLMSTHDLPMVRRISHDVDRPVPWPRRRAFNYSRSVRGAPAPLHDQPVGREVRTRGRRRGPIAGGSATATRAR